MQTVFLKTSQLSANMLFLNHPPFLNQFVKPTFLMHPEKTEVSSLLNNKCSAVVTHTARFLKLAGSQYHAEEKGKSNKIQGNTRKGKMERKVNAK